VVALAHAVPRRATVGERFHLRRSNAARRCGDSQTSSSGEAPHPVRHEFSVQVGRGGVQQTDPKESLAIPGLPLGTRHLVRIRDFGKTVQSFWITFEEHGSSRLCLWYGPFYETWSIWPADEARHFCSCKE
jgi:hypothetical protein